MKNQLIFYIIFLIISVCNLFSQEETNDKYQWTLYNETNGVQIFTKPHECHDYINDIHKQYMLLKIVNTNNENVTVSFDKNLYYNNVYTPGENGENNVILEISPMSSIEGDCDSMQELKIFDSYMEFEPKSKLTKFELTNINVKNN
ncbi:MAG: hypothetical protein Kow0068_03450 [Marinilabiliales bacterium]